MQQSGRLHFLTRKTMIDEKIVKINGKDVHVRYCLAAEQGFEILSGKSIEVFNPSILERDEEGNPTKFGVPEATTEDYAELAFAAIVAAYKKNDEKSPIEAKELLYDTPREDLHNLIAAVTELRLKWYNIPSVVQPETKKKSKKEKNA